MTRASSFLASPAPGPAVGTTRAGTGYDLAIKAAGGNTIAFTVHQPLQLVGGQKYPLLLAGQSLPQRPLVIARNPLLPVVSVSGTVPVPVLGNVATVK